MPREPRPVAPTVFVVPDVAATAGWYRAAGFPVDEGEAGSVRVALGRGEVVFAPGGLGLPEVNVYVSVEDVTALHARLGDRADTLHHTQFGMCEFTLRDPNGLRLTFGQPLPDRREPAL